MKLPVTDVKAVESTDSLFETSAVKVVISLPVVFCFDIASDAIVLSEAMASIFNVFVAVSVTATCSPAVVCSDSLGGTTAAAVSLLRSASGVDAPAGATKIANRLVNFMSLVRFLKS